MNFNRKKNHFFKWVGSKRIAIPLFETHIPDRFNDYYEPFLGSGYMFWTLYNKNSKFNFYLSDINKDLMLTYEIVKKYPERLKEKLIEFESKHNESFFYEIRSLDRLHNYDEIDDIIKAARFIYMTRKGFNGLYRSNSKNQINTPFNKSLNSKLLFENEFDEWSIMLNDQKVNISSDGFNFALNKPQKNDLVYLDPPYLNTFNNCVFTIENHNELKYKIDQLNKRGVKFILSHNEHPIYQDLYKNYNIFYIDVNRFMSVKSEGRGNVKEMIIKNF